MLWRSVNGKRGLVITICRRRHLNRIPMPGSQPPIAANKHAHGASAHLKQQIDALFIPVQRVGVKGQLRVLGIDPGAFRQHGDVQALLPQQQGQLDGPERRAAPPPLVCAGGIQSKGLERHGRARQAAVPTQGSAGGSYDIPPPLAQLTRQSRPHPFSNSYHSVRCWTLGTCRASLCARLELVRVMAWCKPLHGCGWPRALASALASLR